MIPAGCSVKHHNNLAPHTSRWGRDTVQVRPNAIVQRGLAGHWAEILGPEVKQVNETREVEGVRAR